MKINFKKPFGKLLSLAFGLTWMIILFKAFKLNYFYQLSWFTVFLPFLFFIISVLTYVVLLYAYIQWTLPPVQYTKEAQNYLNRRFYQARKPTKIKNTLVKISFALIAIIVAYIILSLC